MDSDIQFMKRSADTEIIAIKLQGKINHNTPSIKKKIRAIKWIGNIYRVKKKKKLTSRVKSPADYTN